MSRAFVKEPDGLESFDELPEKLISEHRNLVTPQGLVMIETEVDRLSEEHAAAQAINDRAAIARAARDLRYWAQRRLTAEVMSPPAGVASVQFGSTVALVRGDGRKQTFRIVGEDEADPAKGTLSYVSPLAQALMDKAAGDTVQVGAGEAEIVSIT
ncbi:MAG: transcription elongation factor GreA [Hyphomicrobium sp.]